MSNTLPGMSMLLRCHCLAVPAAYCADSSIMVLLLLLPGVWFYRKHDEQQQQPAPQQQQGGKGGKQQQQQGSGLSFSKLVVEPGELIGGEAGFGGVRGRLWILVWVWGKGGLLARVGVIVFWI